MVNEHLNITTQLKAASDNMKVPLMYWLPKLHKTPYKSWFISASSKCSTTNVSILSTTALTTIKTLIVNFIYQVFLECKIFTRCFRQTKVCPSFIFYNRQLYFFYSQYHLLSLLRKSFHI